MACDIVSSIPTQTVNRAQTSVVCMYTWAAQQHGQLCKLAGGIQRDLLGGVGDSKCFRMTKHITAERSDGSALGYSNRQLHRSQQLYLGNREVAGDQTCNLNPPKMVEEANASAYEAQVTCFCCEGASAIPGTNPSIRQPHPVRTTCAVRSMLRYQIVASQPV